MSKNCDLILTNFNNIKKNLINELSIGDLILTSKYINHSYLLSPSPIKHVSVYYGNGLKNKLLYMKLNILGGGQESSFLFFHHVYIKDIILKEIDNYLEIVDNTTNYIIEIQLNKFIIKDVEIFINNKDEIIIYKPLIKHPNIFANFYLYFLGNQYSVFYERGKRYCFESVISLISILNDLSNKDKKIELYFIKNLSEYDQRFHFNSLSITKSSNFSLKCIYKNGILKKTKI